MSLYFYKMQGNTAQFTLGFFMNLGTSGQVLKGFTNLAQREFGTATKGPLIFMLIHAIW